MNGGKQILMGLVVLFVFLLQLTLWGGARGLWTLVTGGLPIVLIVVGVVFVVIGAADLKSAKSEAKAASEPA
ncbi:MAG: hypothetical protein HUU35_10615 [Armatimonadetes bacterium]|nr:hypothetical protein [Armatimonadota bacterium]